MGCGEPESSSVSRIGEAAAAAGIGGAFNAPNWLHKRLVQGTF